MKLLHVRRNMNPYVKIICLFPMFLSCKGEKANSVGVLPDSFSGEVRLIEAKCCPPDCGVIAWANAQKFEVTKSDVSSLKGKTIVLI